MCVTRLQFCADLPASALAAHSATDGTAKKIISDFAPLRTLLRAPRQVVAVWPIRSQGETAEGACVPSSAPFRQFNRIENRLRRVDHALLYSSAFFFFFPPDLFIFYAANSSSIFSLLRFFSRPLFRYLFVYRCAKKIPNTCSLPYRVTVTNINCR